MKRNAVIVGLLLSVSAFAQKGKIAPNSDSTLPNVKYLSEITVVGRAGRSDYHQMPEIVGTNIYAGKKNALIVLDNVQGNVTTNTMRQVLAKVPGIHVWESDPSGIQIGIAARGLSPNRSWEFNIRQNGYDIAADPYGYPEAYYNPPLQAVQRIEVVRGQGSLQYGPQFGGMVNYILRNGSEINKKFEFETQQTLGSNNLLNSFNAIGGNTDKVHYYGFFDHRNGDGWRQNSQYFTNAGFGTFTYRFTPKFSLSAEVMHAHMRSQQAGGLTDEQFKKDARQSFRTRNWFDITWTTPALMATYQINDKARWETKIFATIGNRNSVGFLPTGGITVKDSINPATLSYSNRVRNADTYRNYALESRAITDYKLGGMTNTLSGGIRLYTGTTHRWADPDPQNGTGTTGTEYDMSGVADYARNIEFTSKNIAAFAENIFRFTKKLLVVPGMRFEWLEGAASGQNNVDAATGAPVMLQDVRRSRSFLLVGVGAEYHVTSGTEIYANYTQAYRPIQFANLQAPPTSDVVDPELKDARGYNIDLGYRGRIKDYLQFDVSGYYLQYNNRVGTVSMDATATVPAYRLITNVGASTSKGMESYIEFNALRAFTANKHTDLIVFGAYSFTHATYTKDAEKATTKLKGNKVENAPQDIFRGGVTAGYKGVLLTGQVSYVGATFSDANNSTVPTANGNNGPVPSYIITDLTATCRFARSFNIKAGINNVLDKRYFTRRGGGYPGPGILPGDGRTFFLSFGAKI